MGKKPVLFGFNLFNVCLCTGVMTIVASAGTIPMTFLVIISSYNVDFELKTHNTASYTSNFGKH